jgi:hypothetical protein
MQRLVSRVRALHPKPPLCSLIPPSHVDPRARSRSPEMTIGLIWTFCIPCVAAAMKVAVGSGSSRASTCLLQRGLASLPGYVTSAPVATTKKLGNGVSVATEASTLEKGLHALFQDGTLGCDPCSGHAINRISYAESASYRLLLATSQWCRSGSTPAAVMRLPACLVPPTSSPVLPLRWDYFATETSY